MIKNEFYKKNKMFFTQEDHRSSKVLSLKNSPQHCTQWLKKDINSNNNQSTCSTKIHQKGKKLYTWFKNQSAQIHQRKCMQNAQANTTLSAQCVKDKRLSARKVTHFYERCIYESCPPLNHFQSDPQYDLALISERNLAWRLVKGQEVL